MAHSGSRLSYAERLDTFKDSYWDDSMATARQLAAMGHASDRPPLESLEQGSRCISCSFFMSKRSSIEWLDGSINHDAFLMAQHHDFHHERCERLAIRMPHRTPGNLHLTTKFLKRSARKSCLQYTNNRFVLQDSGADESLFWRLPVELRLQIYSYVLPKLKKNLAIVLRSATSLQLAIFTGFQAFTGRRPGGLQLLKTCQTMHDEALGDIYERTLFRFESTKLLYIFLRRIGQRGRRLLKAVDVRCG